ncbi:ABC transporter ATP-binding protein [Faecalibaculum rodentium]|jgi:iron complex transport system ATP-binding protein|uniref:ABC transporter ATP-binding protein n=2 Tax=Faecalibaculum rodentium TaxID=1702221 RepID=UPI00256EEEED|nr:ABC transporter ATP-binding protein [Faecalibaculum rodentium]
MDMIELHHVTAGYGDKPVLHDITAAFQSGELTVIIGPNGSGKSTLAALCMGLVRPMEGKVRWNGRDLHSIPVKERAVTAGLLSQEHPVPSLSVRRLVMHGRFSQVPWPRTYADDDKVLADRALERAGIMDLADCSVAELSGGQRQKAYLAMLLNQDPEMMFFDEPATFLDLPSQKHLEMTMRSLAREGHGVIAVVHDLNTALKLADRILVMEKGQIRFGGTPEQLLASAIPQEVFGARIVPVMVEGSTEYIVKEASGHSGHSDRPQGGLSETPDVL